MTLAPLVNGRSRFGASIDHDDNGDLEPTPAQELVKDWIHRKPAAIKRVKQVLANAGLTMAHVEAGAFSLQVEVASRIDWLLQSTETRRNYILREIEHRRSAFARALRDAADAEVASTPRKALAAAKKNGQRP